jgi:hypothetical protein
VYSRILGISEKGYPERRLEGFLRARAAAGTLGAPLVLDHLREGTGAVRAVQVLAEVGVRVTVIPAPAPRPRPVELDEAILGALATGEAVGMGVLGRRVWASGSRLRRRVVRLCQEGLLVREVQRGGIGGTRSIVHRANPPEGIYAQG